MPGSHGAEKAAAVFGGPHAALRRSTHPTTRNSRSMLEQELGMIQQGPEQVLGGLATVAAGFRERGDRQLALGLGGMTR